MHPRSRAGGGSRRVFADLHGFAQERPQCTPAHTQTYIHAACSSQIYIGPDVCARPCRTSRPVGAAICDPCKSAKAGTPDGLSSRRLDAASSRLRERPPTDRCFAGSRMESRACGWARTHRPCSMRRVSATGQATHRLAVCH